MTKTEKADAAPTLHSYRVPSHLLYAYPDGFRYLEAESPIAVVDRTRQYGIELNNVQVYVEGKWQFASRISRQGGGLHIDYDKKARATS